MARLLYVICDVESAANSTSFNIASKFIFEYFKFNPEDELDIIDLHLDPIQQVDDDVIRGCEKIRSGCPFPELTEGERQKISRLQRVAGNFMAADKYVFVTPDWNAAPKGKLTELINTACAFGKVLKTLPGSPFDPGGKRNKKCLHIYSSVSSGNGREDSPQYFRFILNYLGISELKTLAIIKGNGLPQDRAKEYIAEAEKQAIEKAMKF